MCSTRSRDEEIYEFFENVVDYIKKAKSAESTSELSETESGCNSFMQNFKSKFKVEETAKIICKQLIKLYKSLDSLKNKSVAEKNFKNECRFFNYWVNFKISKSVINESNGIPYIFNGIESQFYSVFYNTLDLGAIYDINKHDLHKINILYNLYDNYSELKSIIETMFDGSKRSLLPFSTECCTNYIQAKYLCNDENKDNNTKFCDKLEDFNKKYDELYKTFDGKRSEFSNNLIKLQECPNTKIITTAVTGTVVGLIPLLGGLYKFTPMGQVIRSKIGIINNDISNNDKEITKMSLMEQENEPLRFKQGTYNIKYQSL
ncbi:Plasmodium vivax Vir protein, putative [Plasmodium vivax]|uniref:Vir protein, putative n=1 Tax=Plasmodium vivax TaxID=5855 RepID=A0A1G4EBC3_PLAVI|nr:Plasmodium vivax Vir protein, putative [Plasmodium vivax]SCA60637.1 Plasmodium vivax Vir protein, putative [Plasmodium vivax]